MPWTRDGAVWTHETCPYAVSLMEDRLQDGSPIDSYVVSVGREYFVGSELDKAQQYAEHLWRMRRRETCPYQIRVGTEQLADGTTRSAFIVNVDGEVFVGSRLEQARRYAEQRWQEAELAADAGLSGLLRAHRTRGASTITGTSQSTWLASRS